MFNKTPDKRTKTEGATLIEVLMALGILALIAGVIVRFGYDILFPRAFFESTLKGEQDIEEIFRVMTPEIRSIAPSVIGGYPIFAASSTSFGFYSDIDHNGQVEQIRYFMADDKLQKGVVKPAGNPPSYGGEELVTDVIKNLIIASSSFSYFDSNYTGEEPSLFFPVDTLAVRVIKLDIIIQGTGDLPILPFTIQFTPRNLRSN